MKRILCLFVLAVLLCGCGASEKLPDPEKIAQPEVVLRYYTIGRADPDLELVEDALNSLLLERYGFTVDYRKLDWNEYENTVNAILNTDQDFDIMFTWDAHYSRYANNGAFLNLDPYLAEDGHALYEAVDPSLWQGVRIRGNVYGVPTNKELAPVVQFVFSSDLVSKYQIQTENYRTLDSLEPLLAMISRQEPDVVPLLFTSERTNLADLTGYEYVAGGQLPLVIRYGDPGCQVVNLYETEEMKHLQDTMRRYYQKGYINSDATLRTAISRFSEEQVFCRIATGGPDSEESFAVDFGYPVTTVLASTPRITNSSARGGIMAINARTPHPKEALAFLNAVNLDPDVRNLLNFGIQDVHYELTDQDQVRVISDRYRGVPYTQGNWFLLKTMEGESPRKWDHYREYNRNAEPSYLLGFEPDMSSMEHSCDTLAKIYRRFDNPLLTGSVDPEQYRARALEQMEHAGIDNVIRELQKQVDDWRGK